MAWNTPSTLKSKSFTCGHCGNQVASALGYKNVAPSGLMQSAIFICPHCVEPTYFSDNGQTPGVRPGNHVEHLPVDVAGLYHEARSCAGIGAHTSSVLACRKLLMNIAVSHGAKEGLTFVAYVEHLSSAGFVPPNGKGWVDYIRKKGNEATHEIALMNSDDATRLVAFAEMLLKFIYEFPAAIPTP